MITAKLSVCNVNGHLSPVPYVSVSSAKVPEDPLPAPPSAVCTSTQVQGNEEDSSSRQAQDDDDDDEDTSSQGYHQSGEVEICTISDECFAIPADYRRLHESGYDAVDQEGEESHQI